MNRMEVVSSHIASVGWEPGEAPGKGTLEVEFHRGAVYRYRDVPAVTVLQMLMAPSIGGAFHTLIRSQPFEFERIRP